MAGVAMAQEEELYISRDLIPPNQFKAIEGPAVSADGVLYAVNFQRQGTIGSVSADGQVQLFLELANDSIGNGIRFDSHGAMLIADYTNHNVLRIDMATRTIGTLAHESGMNQPNDLAIAPDGTAPLAVAVLNAHYALATLLLDEGAEPNAADPRGSMLHALAWKRRPGNPGAAAGRAPEQRSDRDSLALAEALLSRGAKVDARIAWDEVRFDVDIGSVRSPRNIGVGRNYLSFIGATPFYLAAKHGDIDFMRVLVEHGANPLTPTEQNITPLMAAAGLGFWDGESPGPLNGTPDSERLDAVKYALELGNKVDAIADFGEVHMEGDGVTLLLRHPLNLGDLGQLPSRRLIVFVVPGHHHAVSLAHGPGFYSGLGGNAFGIGNLHAAAAAVVEPGVEGTA